MTALEELIAIAEGRIEAPALYKTLGITVNAAEPGKASLTLAPSDRLRSPLGTVGGGVIATVLDTAIAWACDTMLPDGKVCTTVEIKTNFLKPVQIDAAPLVASASVRHSGHRIIVAQGDLHDDSGVLHATATATCLVIDMLQPRSSRDG